MLGLLIVGASGGMVDLSSLAILLVSQLASRCDANAPRGINNRLKNKHIPTRTFTIGPLLQAPRGELMLNYQAQKRHVVLMCDGSLSWTAYL